MRLLFLAAVLTPATTRGPHSANSTFVVLINTTKLKQFQNELPSHERKELYHFLLRCFDIQIGKNTIASERNITFLQHWILFMDDERKHKVDDVDKG